MKNLNAMLLCDFYKLAHRQMYPEKTEVVLSTWTPRTSRIEGVEAAVSFGQQSFIKTYLIDFFNTNFFQVNKTKVVSDYKRLLKYTLGVADADTSHIEALHDLGYLPLKIKSLEEGTLVPLRVPMLTIENTDKRFFWLTNYIETLASCELWQASTSATIANEYRKLLEKASLETVGNIDFVQFQGHDFSLRGMGGLNAGINSGMGHLLSFVGTDTIPAIQGLEEVYGANVEKELVGTSIPASEHSIQSSYADDMKYFDNLISKVHPNGFVSIVSDGYDFWDVIGRVVPALKEKILARSGGPVGDRVVIRPDSGDPVKIICGDKSAQIGSLQYKGAIEALWDIFGGTVTEKGYKVLDSHIGLIYGDAITLGRTKEIIEGLKAKGFASINAVLGIGSYTYQYNTRDTLGFALKSTLAVIDGDEKQIFKSPKTDDGTKVSQRGNVAVLEIGGKLCYTDGLMLNDEVTGNLLQTIFENGKLVKETTLAEIRKKVRSYDSK